MKANTGRRTADGCAVTVSDDGGELALTLRLDLRRHSLTGFEWGYGGSRVIARNRLRFEGISSISPDLG